MKRAIFRLWLCALLAAGLFGAWDGWAHGPQLRWHESVELVGLYLLLGGIAAAVALPFAAALMIALRRVWPAERSAPALLWLGLTTLLLGAVARGDVPPLPALAAMMLLTLVCRRAARRGSFADPRRFAHPLFAAIVLLAVAATPPIARWRESAAPIARRERGGGRPDLVLIVLDTQRADVLGAYGDARGLSPEFDRLAREGTLFENAFSSAPWTVPSHASLFTALEPPSHGCSFEHHRWLDRRLRTIAETLRDEAGYQTAAFAANDWLAFANLVGGRFEHVAFAGPRYRELSIRPLLELLGWPARFADHGATDALAEVRDFLAHDRDPERPLFLFVNLLESHWRYLPPLRERIAELARESAGEGGPGVVGATRLSTQTYGPLVMAGKEVAPKSELDRALRGLYAAATKYQDERLGELMDLLRAGLELDRSAVMVTADHGENLGDGGRYDHVFAVNDALVHVPLVVRAPGAMAAGARDGRLCQLVDVPVTLAEIAGVRADRLEAALNETIVGRSLLGEGPGRDFVFAAGDPYLGHLDAMTRFSGMNRDVTRFAGVLRSLRDRRFKLVRSSLLGDQLFDLEADRDETHDVAGLKPEVAAAMAKKLDEYLASLRPYMGPPRRAPEDDDEEFEMPEGLSNLGYVQPVRGPGGK